MAFILPYAHIATLVSAAVQLDVAEHDEGDDLHAMLQTTSNRDTLIVDQVAFRTSDLTTDLHPAAICRAVDEFLIHLDAIHDRPPSSSTKDVARWCQELREAAEDTMRPHELLLRSSDLDGLVPAYRLGRAYKATPAGIQAIQTVPRLDFDQGPDGLARYDLMLRRNFIDALHELEHNLSSEMATPLADAVTRLRESMLKTALMPETFTADERERALHVFDDLSDIHCEQRYLAARIFDADVYDVWVDSMRYGAEAGDWVSRLCRSAGFADMPWLRRVPAGRHQPLPSNEHLVAVLHHLVATVAELPDHNCDPDAHVSWLGRVDRLAGSIAATLDSDMVSAGVRYRGERLLAAVTQRVIDRPPSAFSDALIDAVEFEGLQRDINTTIAQTIAVHDTHRQHMIRAAHAGHGLQFTPDLGPYNVNAEVGSTEPSPQLSSRNQLHAYLDRLVHLTRTAPPGTGFDTLARPLLSITPSSQLVESVEFDRLNHIVAALAGGEPLTFLGDRSAWTTLVTSHPDNRFTSWISFRGYALDTSTKARTVPRREVVDAIELYAEGPRNNPLVRSHFDDAYYSIYHTDVFAPEERDRFGRVSPALQAGECPPLWPLVTNHNGAFNQWIHTDTALDAVCAAKPLVQHHNPAPLTELEHTDTASAREAGPIGP
ncbi:hypothetical protein ACL02S_23215 [Nocardia sp. 004]|uniref:hypothetical protein n=1 Tax=Nocardia sp. 004 TaxID=3385978 RepID=UPI00399FBEBF